MSELTTEEMVELLVVGVKIKLGEFYCDEHYRPEDTGKIITLVKGFFEHDNGLYIEEQTAPSVWNEAMDEFDSIYHLFGNDLDGFTDCEIVEPAEIKAKWEEVEGNCE